MTLQKQEVRQILDQIDLGELFDNWHFRLLEKSDGFLVQLRFMAVDTETKKRAVQSCRKWYVSAHSTRTEVVETAFKACRMATEHELREAFHYQGQAVYSPHFNIEQRAAMCKHGELDRRPNK